MQEYDAANLKNAGLLNTLSQEYSKELYKGLAINKNPETKQKTQSPGQ